LLFAGNRTTNQLSRIDAQTGSLLRQVTLTDVPYALAYNPRLNQLLVVLADTNQLGVFDADSLALLARLGVGTQGANGGDGLVAWNERIYVSNNGAHSLSVLQYPCGVVTRWLALPVILYGP
jgi:DNA-binding beta-propeller fold protein YncE